MHVKALKLFCDVVGRRSFSLAARENGMSQSGASQIVHQLEEHLGVKLLDRSKRPFVLTPEGEAYYEGCRKLVQRFYALEEEVRTLHQEVAGRVAVASIYSVGLSHMNQCVREFLSQHPRANVRVEYQHPAQVYELVESDRADLGLVSYPRSTRNIRAIAWRQEPMVVVCSPSHRLASQSSVALTDLHGLDMVGFDPDLEIRHEIDKRLASAEADVHVVMQFDNIETIKRAIEIDAGVALLPAPTVEREVQMGSLVAVPLSGEPLVRPLGIIFRRGSQLGKTARRFMELLLERSHPAANHDKENVRESQRSSVRSRTSPDRKMAANSAAAASPQSQGEASSQIALAGPADSTAVVT